jgi:putative addiction module component (TIGR02574 family)
MLAVFVHGVMNPGPSKLLKDVLTLSVTDRRQLLWEIWDSLAATPEAIRVTDSQCNELARRHRARAQSLGCEIAGRGTGQTRTPEVTGLRPAAAVDAGYQLDPAESKAGRGIV